MTIPLSEDHTFCPHCRCPVQRTPKGDVLDGLLQHVRVVHPDYAQHPSYAGRPPRP